MNQSRARHFPDRSAHAPHAQGTSIGQFFRRQLEDDLVVRDEGWLRSSGIQQQLEFEGYQLRWVSTNKVKENLAEGWRHVTVKHRMWWLRHVRRRHGAQNQYLLKRTRSFR